MEIIADRIRREHGIETITGAPQVAYRETFLESARVEGKWAKWFDLGILSRLEVMASMGTYGLKLNRQKEERG